MRARTWCASRDVPSTCASPRCTGGSGAGTAGQDEGKVGVGALCAAGLNFVKWGEGTTEEAPWEQHQPRGHQLPGRQRCPASQLAHDLPQLSVDTRKVRAVAGGPPRHCCAWTCTASSSLQVPARSGCRKKLDPKAPARETPGREGRRPRRQGGWQLGEGGGGARSRWWEGRGARHVSDAVCAWRCLASRRYVHGVPGTWRACCCIQCAQDSGLCTVPRYTWRGHGARCARGTCDRCRKSPCPVLCGVSLERGVGR